MMSNVIKTPKWRRDENAVAVASWMLLNHQELINYVTLKEPLCAEQFYERLNSLSYNLTLSSEVSKNSKQCEESLRSVFETVSPILEKKLEIRYRAYAYRKQKRREDLQGILLVPVRDTQRTWITEKQAPAMLNFIYDRLDSFQSKRNFFLDEEHGRLKFTQGILDLYSKFHSKKVNNEQLLEHLTNLIKESIHLAEWRKFKSLFRTEKSSKDRGVQTIKVDSQAKKLLEKIKKDNKLNTLSEAIMHLGQALIKT